MRRAPSYSDETEQAAARAMNGFVAAALQLKHQYASSATSEPTVGAGVQFEMEEISQGTPSLDDPSSGWHLFDPSQNQTQAHRGTVEATGRRQSNVSSFGLGGGLVSGMSHFEAGPSFSVSSPAVRAGCQDLVAKCKGSSFRPPQCAQACLSTLRGNYFLPPPPNGGGAWPCETANCVCPEYPHNPKGYCIPLTDSSRIRPQRCPTHDVPREHYPCDPTSSISPFSSSEFLGNFKTVDARAERVPNVSCSAQGPRRSRVSGGISLHDSDRKKRKCEMKKNPDAPKRFKTAYILFCIDKRPEAVEMVRKQEELNRAQELQQPQVHGRDAIFANETLLPFTRQDVVPPREESARGSLIDSCSTESTDEANGTENCPKKKPPHDSQDDVPSTEEAALSTDEVNAKINGFKKKMPHGSQRFNGEVIVALSNLWRNLSPNDKATWEEKAKSDRARFEAETKNFEGPLVVPRTERAKKPAGAPKRNPSAFLLFARGEQRSAVTRETPGLDSKAVMKLLGQRWREMSDVERSPYIAAEAKERAAYLIAKKEFIGTDK